MHLAQVAAHAAQLGRVVRPLATTTTRAALDLVAQPGQPLAVQEQRLLAAQELGAVVREGLELGGESGVGGAELARHDVLGDLAAFGDDLVTDQHRPAEHPHSAAVADHGQGVAATGADELVDHRDAGVRQDLGSAVGETAGDHLRTVQHGHHAGLHERVGRGAVEVDLVEHGHLTRLEAGEVAVLDQVDLDGPTAEALVEAGVVAVVNRSEMISGRFPNRGPQILVDAGIPMVDQLVGTGGRDPLS